jgi:mannitol-specific phosphotransferase system IIBC component
MKSGMCNMLLKWNTYQQSFLCRASITPQQNASLRALHQSMQFNELSRNSNTNTNTAQQDKKPTQAQQPEVDKEEKPAVGSEEWHRQRRENHKQVERRRRETINDGINEIARIVPGCEKNKGSILQRAAIYIRQLKEAEAATVEKWTLEKLLTDQAISELNRQVEVFKAELERVRAENVYLKRKLETAATASTVNSSSKHSHPTKKQKLANED